MAQKVQLSVEVSKETVEIYEGVAALLESIALAKAAGATGVALIGAATAALQPLITAIDGIGNVGAEHNEDLPEAVAAHGVGSGLVGKAVVHLVKAQPAAAPSA